MRYKANYCPSELLCPEEFSWHFLSEAVQKRIDQEKYCRLADGEDGGIATWRFHIHGARDLTLQISLHIMSQKTEYQSMWGQNIP